MDEADFKQAVRLLHVTRAWIGSPPPAANDPVRQDPLYPMQHESQRQRPMLAAINELLAKYPYEPISIEQLPGTDSRSLQPQ